MVGASRARVRLAIGGATVLACIPALRYSDFLSEAHSACGWGGDSRPTNRNHTYPEFDGGQAAPPAISTGKELLARANGLTHYGKFGLGHRIMKASCAWHLVRSLNLSRMDSYWLDCSGAGNVFSHMFGNKSIYNDDPDVARAAVEANAVGNVGKTISTNNDVSGYYGAKNFKLHRVPLPQNFRGDGSPFLEKLESDLQFYRMLLRRFVGRGEAIRFMEEHDFRGHFVVGIHLRLGNGEPENFKALGREVEDPLAFIYNLVDLVKLFLEEMQTTYPERFAAGGAGGNCTSPRKRAPLLFLATDSPKFIPLISNDTEFFGVKTVVFPQIHLEEGVSFDKLKTGARCVQGWREMLLDSVLLGFSDVLVAARHSSFMQSLPMSLAFDRGRGIHGPHFCEVSDTGKTMTCMEDIHTWLFRDDSQKIFTYSIASESVSEGAVVHTLHVHLPDVVLSDQYPKALHFLDASNNASRMLTYGQEFDPKYRWKLSCPACTEFTFS